jgi:hypothetical protein
MMEAVRTSETSVDIILHGSTSQKTILNIYIMYLKQESIYCFHWGPVQVLKVDYVIRNRYCGLHSRDRRSPQDG